MKHIIYILLLSPFFVNAQYNYDPICWLGAKALTFDDFRGAVRSDSLVSVLGWKNKPKGASSLIMETVVVDYDSINERRFISYFERRLSWVSANEFLLKHEQTHFNILELSTRKYNSYLDSISLESSHKINFDSLYKVVFEEWAEINKLYDEETAHGVKSDINREWNKKIIEALMYYKDYSFLCNRKSSVPNTNYKP